MSSKKVSVKRRQKYDEKKEDDEGKKARTRSPGPEDPQASSSGENVIHAEESAINNKTGDVTGGSIYVTIFPCDDCAELIIQEGIREVIYFSDEKNQGKKYQRAMRRFKKKKVKHRQFQRLEDILNPYPA